MSENDQRQNQGGGQGVTDLPKDPLCGQKAEKGTTLAYCPSLGNMQSPLRLDTTSTAPPSPRYLELVSFLLQKVQKVKKAAQDNIAQLSKPEMELETETDPR